MIRKAVYREHYPFPEEPEASEFALMHIGTIDKAEEIFKSTFC